MKKLFMFLILLGIFIAPLNAFADRNTATVTTYNSSTLIKTGEGLVYSVTFVATSNGGNFIVYDATSATGGYTDIKAEGSEATSANGHYQDFSDKPLEFGTGIYLAVTSGYVILRYE